MYFRLIRVKRAAPAFLDGRGHYRCFPLNRCSTNRTSAISVNVIYFPDVITTRHTRRKHQHGPEEAFHEVNNRPTGSESVARRKPLHRQSITQAKLNVGPMHCWLRFLWVRILESFFFLFLILRLFIDFQTKTN
jgi:hypothetical protein